MNRSGPFLLHKGVFPIEVLALVDEEPDFDPDALDYLLDGFVLTVLIAVVIGTIYYAVRVVQNLRRSIRR